MNHIVQRVTGWVIQKPPTASFPPQFQPTYDPTSADYYLPRFLRQSPRVWTWWRYFDDTSCSDKYFYAIAPDQLQTIDSSSLRWRTTEVPEAIDLFLGVVSRSFWYLALDDTRYKSLIKGESEAALAECDIAYFEGRLAEGRLIMKREYVMAEACLVQEEHRIKASDLPRIRLFIDYAKHRLTASIDELDRLLISTTITERKRTTTESTTSSSDSQFSTSSAVQLWSPQSVNTETFSPISESEEWPINHQSQQGKEDPTQDTWDM